MSENKENNIAEEVIEEAEAVENEAVAAAEEVKEEIKEEVVLSGKRLKKKERREAKAARKAANEMVEKQKRPSNLLLAILIFGVIIAMFAFIWGYNYFSKEASIQTYIENNGGEDSYSNIAMDAESVMSVTAEGNDMNITIDVTCEHGDEDKEFYTGDEGQAYLKYIAAYYLLDIKPQTRAFSAKADVVVNLNEEEITTVTLKYSEAEEAQEAYIEMIQSETEESEETEETEE